MKTAAMSIKDSLITQRILWWSIGIAVGVCLNSPVADPDLWWHITIGRWILAHGELPYVDYWNMFSSDTIWRAYSWSSEILMAFVHDRWHDQGLLFLQVLLGIALAVTYQFVFGALARNNWIGVLLAIIVASGCYANFTLRPQVVVWICYSLLILLSYRIAERGISLWRLLLVVFIGMLWANTHISAIIGIVATFFWSLDPGTVWRRALIVSGAFFVGTLITPYLGGEWLTFFAQSNHPLLYQSIAEFKPATIFHLGSLCLVAMLSVFVLSTYITRVAPQRSLIVGASVLVLAGAVALKFLPFALITVASLYATWWCRIDADLRNPLDRVSVALFTLQQMILKKSIWWAGVMVLLLNIMSIGNFLTLRKTPIDTTRLPKTALDFIETHKLSHPLLNEFSTGGYIIFRSSNARGEPLQKVVIDGRTNVNSKDIWELYRASFSGKESWYDFVKKVNPKTILWHQGSPMNALLLGSPHWCRVFSSSQGEKGYSVFITKEEFYTRSKEFPLSTCYKN